MKLSAFFEERLEKGIQEGNFIAGQNSKVKVLQVSLY